MSESAPPSTSGSMAERLRSMCDGLESKNPRPRLVAALDRFAISYDKNDVVDRCALFADSLVFEDPVGVVHASNIDQLRAFVTGVQASGVVVDRKVEHRVVIGDEAMERVTVTVEPGSASAVYIELYTHYRFDDQGLITSYRTFFDGEAITT